MFLKKKISEIVRFHGCNCRLDKRCALASSSIDSIAHVVSLYHRNGDFDFVGKQNARRRGLECYHRHRLPDDFARLAIGW